jgi:hypothetical protein
MEMMERTKQDNVLCAKWIVVCDFVTIWGWNNLNGNYSLFTKDMEVCYSQYLEIIPDVWSAVT